MVEVKEINQKEIKQLKGDLLKYLIEISLLIEDNKERCLYDYEKCLGFVYPYPHTRKILKFLMNNEILELKEEKGNKKLYIINKKKMKEFLLTQEIILKIRECLDVYGILLE